MCPLYVSDSKIEIFYLIQFFELFLQINGTIYNENVSTFEFLTCTLRTHMLARPFNKI
jgi:hypothetical protein